MKTRTSNAQPSIEAQIDYILCIQNTKHHITNARAYRGTTLETDHNIVATNLALNEKFKKFKQKKDKSVKYYEYWVHQIKWLYQHILKCMKYF